MSIARLADSLRSEDRGASAILIAFASVVLMGFAAVAVDAGLAFEDRRQQQSAADVGALAALQFARTGLASSHPDCAGLTGSAFAACRGAEEALAVVDGTLPGRYPDTSATGEPDWDTCTDSNKPGEFTVASAISDCISFTANFQKSRVLLPGTDVDTSFARVIGFDSVFVDAEAEASLDLDQSADVLPFAVGPTGALANQSCLFANSSSVLDIDPCNGPEEGNFGKLDLALYGNASYGTPQICGNSNSSLKIATNIIMGADHLIEVDGATPGTVNDFSNCPVLSIPVDNLFTQTGNSENGIAQGLWGAVTSPAWEGRIRCKDGDTGEGANVSPTSSWPCVAVNNQMPESLDDTPLWHYLRTPVTDVNPAGSCDSVSTRQEMETCLQAWRDYGAHSATSSLFKASLETAPRFGAVPKLDSDPSNGTGDYDVVDFIPTYLETIYLKCNANTCDVVHSPGEAGTSACANPLDPMVNSCGMPSTGNKNMTAMTGFMLRFDMLHPDTQARFPGADGTVVFNLSK